MGRKLCKIFAVKFNGLYPVGACAVVVAENAGEAAMNFRQLWRDAHPNLDPSPVTIEEIPSEPGTVRILLDGEY